MLEGYHGSIGSNRSRWQPRLSAGVSFIAVVVWKMPELPEVEVICRRFRPSVLGRRVETVEVLAAKQVHPFPGSLDSLCGKVVGKIERRGKLVSLFAEGVEVVFHLRMSGSLMAGNQTEAAKHTRVLFRLSDGFALRFDDPRRFGGVFLGPPFPPYVSEIAPSPIDREFDAEYVIGLARLTRKPIKLWLMDQRALSGCGNIYADEALHRVGVNPFASAKETSNQKLKEIFVTLQELFLEAIGMGGASIDWAYSGGSMQNALRVYGRRGQSCFTCGSILAYARLSRRGTTWCPNCQA